MRMPDVSPPTKLPRRPRKPPSARPEGAAERAEAPPAGLRATHRTEAVHAAIARRAYEISQGDGAESDEANWLRAEREVLGT